MKANELIHNGLYKVGDDIVCFQALNGCLYRYNGYFYGQLYENSKDGSLEVQVSFGTWKKLEPITLTEEMLFKNGLRIADYPMVDYYVYYDNRNHRPLYIRINNEQYLDAECVHDDAYLVFDCEYVHELQHALRLCEFNELADNFKVE